MWGVAVIDAGSTGHAGRIAPYWIQTWSGRAFDLSAPAPEMVDATDLAHALAMMPRYCGHCAWHYSIAQHSVLVSEIVAATAPELALAALLHDGGEAYTGDWSSPLKALIGERSSGSPIGNVAKRVENDAQHAVEARFGVALLPVDRRIVKHADLVALATEKRDLFGPPPQAGWGDATGYVLPAPLETRIEEWPWEKAKRRFLDAFERLGGGAL